MRSNNIISFLMVEGLRYNAVITCLMEDQNTNEPVVMWTLCIKECIQPLHKYKAFINICDKGLSYHLKYILWRESLQDLCGFWP